MKHARLPMACASLTAIALAVAPAPAQAGLVSIGTNFTANSLGDTSASSVIPPDTDGSVGVNHYIEFTNGTYSVWDKATGTEVGSKITDAQFWNNAGISTTLTGAGLSDTRMIYDPASGHWFAAEITTKATGNSMLIGVSNDSDPTHGFKATSLVISTQFGDYTTLGVNATGLFVGVHNFTSSSGSDAGTVNVVSIPKADLLAVTPSVANATPFNNLPSSTYGGIAQFANDLYGASANKGLVVANSTTAGGVKLYGINNPGTPPATLTPVTSTSDTATTNPSNAHQPSGTRTVDGGDSRFSGNAFAITDSRSGQALIYAVRTFTSSAHDAIAWSIYDANTMTTVATGSITSSVFDYIYPSIAANSIGDVVIGYTRSGGASAGTPDGYLSAAASAGVFDGTTITFDPTLVLQQGQGNYSLSSGGRTRWGDFSATGLDPTDPNSFWTTQEWAQTNARFGIGWATQVTQLTFVTVPEPSALAMTALGLGTLAGICLRKRLGHPAS